MHPRTKKKEKKPPNKAFLMKQYQYLPRRDRWNEHRLGVYNVAVMTVVSFVTKCRFLKLHM
jgi:hypothetical protein